MTSISLQPLDIQAVTAHQLLFYLDLALSPPSDPSQGVPYTTDDTDKAVPPEEHVQIVRRVLTHVLGEDIHFPVTDTAVTSAKLERKLSQLYQGASARKLCADTLGVAETDVSAAMMRQFLARIAWLNESSVATDSAKAQFERYLYESSVWWGASAVAGQGDYDELAELFTDVPEDLRLWMVQFKRAARRVPVAEWIAEHSASMLYQGLVARRQGEGASRPVEVFCEAFADLMPSAQYRDQDLLSALDQHLNTPELGNRITRYLGERAGSEPQDDEPQADLSATPSPQTVADYLRKVAAYAVNPDNERWLAPALDKASRAPGMRALSLAIKLRFEHSTLAFEHLMMLATLLMKPALSSGIELDDALPHAQDVGVEVPRLDTWSTWRNADYLFAQLGIDLLCQPDGTQRVLRMSPYRTWHALAHTAQFESSFAPLLGALDWYGGKAGEQASPRITQALAGRAIIDYFLSPTHADEQSLETLLRSKWVLGYSHRQLSEQVKTLIRGQQPNVSSTTVDMLHYLLLREVMPELLVDRVPDHLQYGRSLQSAAFIHGVALVEAMTPGGSVNTTYDDLIGVSAALAQSADPAVHTLWAATLSLPALRYATAHGIVQWSGNEDVQQASTEQISQALNYLKAQQDLHAKELNELLSIKPPDRKVLAEQMLKEAAIPHWLWDQAIKIEHWPVLQNNGLSVAASYTVDKLTAVGQQAATVIELVMMGEVYKAGVPTVPEAYDTAFEAFRKALVSAETEVVKRLLNEMQPSMRSALLDSTCEVSRVQFGNEEGLQGIFIRCQQGDHLNDFEGHSVNERFFELVPSAGVAREITQTFNYEVEDVTWSGTPSISQAFHLREAHKQRIEKARTTPLLPMDSDAYLKGAVSRSLTELHSPQLATLIPSEKLIYLPAADQATAIAGLAGAVAAHLLASFMDQSQIEHQHETAWERTWAAEREYADQIARFIVPFYSCIKDLKAGDTSSGVIIGCVMDVASALLPLGQFAASTARVVLRAGEMGVLSVTRLTGKALGRLVGELAKQSGAFALRDLTKLGLKLGKAGWATLFQTFPALRTVFSSRAVIYGVFSLDRGMYRVLDSQEHFWQSGAQAVGRHAMVDGHSATAVRDIGTAPASDFRLLDPESDRVFGRQLTPISAAGPLELSSWSAAQGIAPEHYPEVLPVTSGADGFHEVRIDNRCRVSTIERGEGEFDVLVDDEVYHLDTGADDAAMRKRTIAPLSPASQAMNEVENLCRVRRDLTPVPCATGVKLSTPAAEPVQSGSTSPKLTGKYPSRAMDAREFTLDRLSIATGTGPQDIDVFVNEGKYCKWAEPVDAHASTSVEPPASPDKVLVPLSQEERALLSLPETPVYLPELDGALATDHLLGLPENYLLEDSKSIYQHIPVVALGPVATGIKDARTLRGIRMDFAEQDWIFVEADNGVFYKAPTPVGEEMSLKFSRVEEIDEINEFVRLSEQYRVFRERPDAVVDQQNIARLLFDLLDESERASWPVSWSNQLATYDDYARWCKANNQRNELLRIASNVLSGDAIQKRFVDLAKASIPDFKKIAERSLPEQQHIVEVLNRLLPVQGSTARWEVLDMQNVITPKAPRNILRQVKGANLSFAQVYTEEGERVVYYALSGGHKAKDLKLQLDLADTAERVIDDVVFRDARARMIGRAPDPHFTSLPVVRDANQLVVREFSRQLDSERLIATVLKEDMAARRLTDIKVFTVMDTCRSCGGFVLPRLKLDFPDAKFSVTYLKDYSFS